MSGQPATPVTGTYEKYAGNPAENYERYFVPVIGAPSARPLLEAARLRAGERVLDVACGTGVAARLAAEAVVPGGSVAAIDENPGMLQAARNAAPAGAPIEWHQARAEDLPLLDGSFDAVLCSLGFQFFTDKVQALAEMRRVLAPGGRAVLGTPGPTPDLFQAIEEVLGEHLGPQGAMFVDAVFALHDPAAVRDLLDAAGFDDARVESRKLVFRLPPPADFFWQYVCSTPLAAAAAQLDHESRQALERDVVQRCQPFVGDGGLDMTTGLLVTTARR